MPQGIQIPSAPHIARRLAGLLLAGVAMLASGAVWADPPGRVGRISMSAGTVWIFDDEQGEWTAAQRNRPVTQGDRISVERDARIEVQIGSSTLRVDSDSELEMTELNDDHVRLQLHHGSLALRVRSPESVREFSVLTSEGRFEPLRPGHYRIDQEDNGSFAGVMAGALRFEAQDSALELNAGQRAEFWSENGVTHYSWSSLPGDRFGNWVAERDREDERLARSRAYVSPEMTGADDLYRYGDWDRHPEYGVLWYPRDVVPGWAPYRYGHWAYVRPWGYTWVDDAPWGFAPFHYGRWVFWQGRWGWVPGQYVARPVYAPALVAWIGGPNVSVGINIGGPAVGWVPLSPREVYRPHYTVTNIYITNINSPYRRWNPPGQPVRTGPIMYTNQGVPGGVTVVSQNVLRERRPISNAVIAPVDPRTVQRWQAQPQPQQPTVRGDDHRPQAFVPPPPSPSRAIAVPGGAVPSAPGAARNTRWGPVAPNVQPGVQAAPGAPAERGNAAPPQQAPGRRAVVDPRPPGLGGSERPVVAPAAPAAPAAVPAQRERQDRRAGPDGGRAEPVRRVPPVARPEAPVVQPAQPIQSVRPVPPPGPAVQVVPPGRAAIPEHANNPRGRGNEANDREERRRERPQQNN